MNIYNAILAAADHIERNPEEFSFGSIIIPKEPCGSPGCALGWIGHFADAARPHSRSISCVAANDIYDEKMRRLLRLENPLLGITHGEFYARMDALAGSYDWRREAPTCARALRLYAKKYHAPARNDARALYERINSIQRIPDSIVSEEVA